MKICIVGFGASGITAARYASVNHDCTVFERTSTPGGTWVYTDDIGNDEFDIPIHTSMYKNLRTNLPKEVMGYTDFPILKPDKSFITQTDVMDYINLCIKHFQLLKYVKFRHAVEEIKFLDDKWKVTVFDLINEIRTDYLFDAVMVCNGHYHIPLYPTIIPGIETFTGEQLHSHYYRRPDSFRGKNVCVIGAGPSGTDISADLSTTANQVYLSCRNGDEGSRTVFPDKIQIKHEIEKIEGDIVFFVNGESAKVDFILYCTGYHYNFPFLDESCGIKVEDDYVFPLYKHMININHPTMVFIGIPFRTVILPLFEIQCRSFINLIDKNVEIPSRELMMEDMKRLEEEAVKRGLPKRKYHMISNYIEEYFEQVAKMGQAEPIPDVVFGVYHKTVSTRKENFFTFRNALYTINDSNNFIVLL